MDNSNNIPCPNKHCFGGAVELGKFDKRTGNMLTEVCPVCSGHAFITAEEAAGQPIFPQPKCAGYC